jgi:hypothetical protein
VKKCTPDQPVQVNIGAAEDFSAEKAPVTYILSDSFHAAAGTIIELPFIINTTIRTLHQRAKALYSYKGIEGLYMAGQWVEAWGGITTAAQSGRKAIQAMCKQDGRVFKTTKA